MYIGIVTFLLFVLILLFINYEFIGFRTINTVDSYVLYIPKRLKYIRGIMRKLNLKPTFVKGPNKNLFKYDELIENGTITEKWLNDSNSDLIHEKNKINFGKIACHLGHISILKKFINDKSSSKYALIMEDDIYVQNNHYKKNNHVIYNIIKKIPDDADIVYLGYCWEFCNKTIKHNYYFNVAHKPLCRHIYLINKNAASVIINKTLPMYNSGDQMISKLIQNKTINGYVVNPTIIGINQNRSLFGSTLDNSDQLRFCYPAYLQ